MELKLLGFNLAKVIKDIESLKLDGEGGQMTVLENHMELYAGLKDGIVVAKTKSEKILSFLVTQAVAIVEHKTVTICADLIEALEGDNTIRDLEQKIAECETRLESTPLEMWKRRLAAYKLLAH